MELSPTMAPSRFLAPDPAFWRHRRVLLTGDTGFNGSWLALWLLELGPQVSGFSLAPDTSPSLFEQLGKLWVTTLQRDYLAPKCSI